MPSTTSSGAVVGGHLRSPQLQLVDYLEDKDKTSEGIRNVLPSLPSTSFIPPEHQVTWSKVLKDPPRGEATNDELQKEMSSSLSQQSIDSDDDKDTFSQSSVDQS